MKWWIDDNDVDYNEKDLKAIFAEKKEKSVNEKEEFAEVVSTGSLGLDTAIGVGGIPKRAGKIIEMYGWEPSGKSTIAQTIAGNFQKVGEKVLLVDGENSLDEKYSAALGMNLEDLLLIQLDESAGEGAYNKMERIVETGEIGLVIIDSYNSLQPLKLVEGEIGDSTLGLHARMLNQAVMKANYLATKYGTNFLFLGQLREKIGIMFGSPETTQGGNALRFYSHVRLKVSRSTTEANSLKEGDTKIGNKTTVRVEKNKLGSPFKSCSFNILYGKGIDVINELIDIADNEEIIRVYGKSITYNDVKYDGEEFRTMLETDSSLFKEIKQKILEKWK